MAMTILSTVGIAVALLFYGALCAFWLRKPLAESLRRFRALPRIVQVSMAVMVVIATVEAQKQQGSTNEPPLNAPGPLGALSPLMVLYPLGGSGPTVSAEEIQRGYRLTFITNDTSHVHAMPVNAQRLGNVHVHGAASSWGRNILDFGDWSFPLGTNEASHTKLWWFVDGRLRASPHGVESEISTGVQGALAVQGESRLWWAAGDNDSRVVGWENVFLGGGTNESANLQVVLRPDGSFETWSNDVGAVYSRVDPNDWDGDGLDNSIDEQPTTDDGDCFGTGENWFNLNCGNVLSAFSSTNGEISVEWRSNVCESAYYRLQFTAQKDRTRVTITCDGPSNLGDLVVIANSNQVCTVPLLIGAGYRVKASWPVTNISASDPEANISPNSAASDDFEVERPISLEIEGGGGTGQLVTNPDVGAEISGVEGSCCDVFLYGGSYAWGCGGNCGCTGYGQWWDVTATWEGYSKMFSWEEQCGCQARNETNMMAWVTLSATPVVMRGGWLGSVSATFNPPESAEGATATLRLDDGGKVVPWATENRTGSVSLPMSISAGGGALCWLEGVTASDTVGDVRVYLDVTAGEDTYTLTQSVTVACVDRLEMTSTVSEVSSNPPPFIGESECPFNVANSPSVDKHLLIPFCNVATQGENGFTISDFTVEMELVLEPEGVSAAGLQCEWEVVEASPQMSGSLIPLGGLAARFANPKQGGVYRFRSRVNGSPWTEGNVVLPLCGASIDATFDSDMASLTVIMTALRDNMAWYQKQDDDFGNLYFYMANAMDYVGRVDNVQWPTVWKYNQIDENFLKEYYRMGAVAMFRGIPTRVAKLGNFMAAYGTKVVGVWEILRMMSQWKGSLNDTTATMSWNAGTDVALGSNLVERTEALASDMWAHADIKVRRLWPNIMPADNHIETSDEFDYNRFFISPGTVRKSRTWFVPAQN